MPNFPVAYTTSPTVLDTHRVEAGVSLWPAYNELFWDWQDQLAVAPDAAMVIERCARIERPGDGSGCAPVKKLAQCGCASWELYFYVEDAATIATIARFPPRFDSRIGRCAFHAA